MKDSHDLVDIWSILEQNGSDYQVQLLFDILTRKIDKQGDELTDCWHWTASVDKNGYGQTQIRLPDSTSGKVIRAHRLMWVLVNRRPMDAPCARHSKYCDSKLCVRPAHIQPGTHQDNADDKARREAYLESLEVAE